MEKALYIEVNLMGVVVLFIMLLSCRRSAERAVTADRLFRMELYAVMLELLVDTVCWLFDGKAGMTAMAVNKAANCCYFLLSQMAAVSWMLYTDLKLNGDWHKMRKRLYCYAIPITVLFIMTLLSLGSGWFFYIDSTNHYHRGNLFWIHAILCWGFMALSAVYSFVCSLKETYRPKRHEERIIALFLLIPFLASLAQLYMKGVPLVWPSTAVSLLLVFINLQNSQISMDALTQINNRGQFNKYLNARAKEIHTGEQLYLVLVDVDYFKTINDTAGHAVGDNVLIRVAKLLQNCCFQQKQDDFCARYGGDEFAIVCIRRYQDSVLPLLKRMEDALQEENARGQLPVPLSLSYGYCKMDRGTEIEPDELIAAADKEMYRNKAQKHPAQEQPRA